MISETPLADLTGELNGLYGVFIRGLPLSQKWNYLETEAHRGEYNIKVKIKNNVCASKVGKK